MRVRQLLVIELPTEIGENRVACSGTVETHVAPFFTSKVRRRIKRISSKAARLSGLAAIQLRIVNVS
jgi:hypothetical protein